MYWLSTSWWAIRQLENVIYKSLERKIENHNNGIGINLKKKHWSVFKDLIFFTCKSQRGKRFTKLIQYDNHSSSNRYYMESSTFCWCQRNLYEMLYKDTIMESLFDRLNSKLNGGKYFLSKIVDWWFWSRKVSLINQQITVAP